ncbi:hypothetical protein [Nodosilinea sp. P-1105]|uniref:TPR end-of-group domain-containing protein n=1 Tax=Nodosilinea sp. P-1105 TaxID=2546229 RepID=UPI00146D4784|nr:hypothetical protein [Nodosilinea sp. P-1105]NMF85518.1 hypothetical protein [Nodosilinea sp. P-1105]
MYGNDIPIDNIIFRLSEVIAQDYLKLDKENSFIQEHGEDVLGKLETFYNEEGCCPDGNDQAEKMFILRSLPLISSVVQLSTTIKHFNDAMEEVEKLYGIEDNPFDSAIKLSYLVFAFAINRGSQLFSQTPSRSETWNQMRSQVARLLKPSLDMPSDELGEYWYLSAQSYAQQVMSKLGECQIIKTENGEKVEGSDIQRIEGQIKNITDKAAQKLRQAIYIDRRFQNQAKDVQAFNVIWYGLAQDYAQQATSRLRDIERVRTGNLDEPTQEGEIARILVEIEDITSRVIDSLKEAVRIDPLCKEKARTDRTFDSIRANPNFRDLID